MLGILPSSFIWTMGSPPANATRGPSRYRRLKQPAGRSESETATRMAARALSPETIRPGALGIADFLEERSTL
jgi:hypothetical protein